ncbi:hypothetical protein [Pseudomonas citronellolis]|uniref:hypothetical protein n=1 Tax=Pseudomonas citronellolis TaxID=53408 RepID=UPI001E4DC8C0|nr:hypothetical protein [Pseudomonas citronellolis]
MHNVNSHGYGNDSQQPRRKFESTIEPLHYRAMTRFSQTFSQTQSEYIRTTAAS